MPQAIREALTTSIVGMLTVFIILSIIVIAGFFLMKILEKSEFVLNKDEKASSDIPKNHEKATQNAIMIWSSGNARVKTMKKID